MNTLRLALLALLALTVAACDSGTDDPETASVVVGSQGIFSDNSGSVTRFDPETGTATAVPALNGLVQNVEMEGNRLYVFLNFSDSFGTGSGRIAVVDPETGTRVSDIEVGTPRDWAVVGGTAFVSNFYGSSVTPVTLSSGAVGTPIAVGANPEGVAASGDRVFVANYSDAGFGDGQTVSVVSAASRGVVQTVDVGCDGPRFAFDDGDGEVWVVCTGRTVFDDDFNVVDRTNGQVVVLDAGTGAVVERLPLAGQVGNGALGTDAAQSRSRDELYVVVGSQIVVFDTNANAAAAALDLTGDTVSAIAFDDATDRFYLGRLDATSGFSADGTVTIHDRTGAQVGQFAAGVIPTDVAFVR